MSAAAAGAIRRLRVPGRLGSAVLLSTLLIVIVAAQRPARICYYVGQGQWALSKSRYGLALKAFRCAYEVDPTNSESAFWLARSCRKAGDLAGVRRYLAEARQNGYPDRK